LRKLYYFGIRPRTTIAKRIQTFHFRISKTQVTEAEFELVLHLILGLMRFASMPYSESPG
jgi:nitrate reductase gamma subunit